MTERTDRPAILTQLAPILEAVPAEDQPLLVALLERWAGERYRRWSKAAEDVATAEWLRECAEREDDIASRVEGLRPDAAEVQAVIVAAHPTLRALTDGGFEGLPVQEQYALQAAGERLGAATWRSFARAAQDRGDATGADVFASCAPLEEASAEVLENLLADR